MVAAGRRRASAQSLQHPTGGAPLLCCCSGAKSQSLSALISQCLPQDVRASHVTQAWQTAEQAQRPDASRVLKTTEQRSGLDKTWEAILTSGSSSYMHICTLIPRRALRNRKRPALQGNYLVCSILHLAFH